MSTRQRPYCVAAVVTLSIFCTALSSFVQHNVLSFQLRSGENNLDNVTLIRIVAGVLAIIVFVILVFRMKKKVPR